jgi:DUF971 family protein
LTTASPTTAPWPTELRLSEGGCLLTIAFDDGTRHALSAEYLRVESPSAEVQGHSPSQRQTQSGKRNVIIKEIQPIGNYAVRLLFSDGHSTGIYPFALIHDLAVEKEVKWAAYEADLAAKGLSREPR